MMTPVKIAEVAVDVCVVPGLSRPPVLVLVKRAGGTRLLELYGFARRVRKSAYLQLLTERSGSWWPLALARQLCAPSAPACMAPPAQFAVTICHADDGVSCGCGTHRSSPPRALHLADLAQRIGVTRCLLAAGPRTLRSSPPALDKASNR